MTLLQQWASKDCANINGLTAAFSLCKQTQVSLALLGLNCMPAWRHVRERFVNRWDTIRRLAACPRTTKRWNGLLPISRIKRRSVYMQNIVLLKQYDLNTQQLRDDITHTTNDHSAVILANSCGAVSKFIMLNIEVTLCELPESALKDGVACDWCYPTKHDNRSMQASGNS